MFWLCVTADDKILLTLISSITDLRNSKEQNQLMLHTEVALPTSKVVLVTRINKHYMKKVVPSLIMMTARCCRNNIIVHEDQIYTSK